MSIFVIGIVDEVDNSESNSW